MRTCKYSQCENIPLLPDVFGFITSTGCSGSPPDDAIWTRDYEKLLQIACLKRRLKTPRKNRRKHPFPNQIQSPINYERQQSWPLGWRKPGNKRAPCKHILIPFVQRNMSYSLIGSQIQLLWNPHFLISTCYKAGKSYPAGVLCVVVKRCINTILLEK